ncbi:MAG: glutamate--tRNA ligase family protein [Bacteroidota bacterium]
MTRAQNGKLILRIDDLDKARTRPEYVDDIFETLNYLGLLS